MRLLSTRSPHALSFTTGANGEAMKIRGKFTMQSSKQNAYNPTQREVVFGAVYDTTIPEDQRYAEATPSGQITMTVKESVAENWKLGESYYVDFTPVSEAVAG